VNGSGKTTNSAAFIQDQWKVKSNLQFNPRPPLRRSEDHLRARRLHGQQPRRKVSDPKHIGSYTMKNNYAPRLGVVWDPKDNGRSKIYGYFGRFYEAMPLDMNIRALNGEDYIINDYQHPLNTTNLYWYNPTGNPDSGCRSRRWKWCSDHQRLHQVPYPQPDRPRRHHPDLVRPQRRSTRMSTSSAASTSFANVWSAGVRLGRPRTEARRRRLRCLR